ncbi:hypothetical protein MMC09_000049 [Bachmanniomyces sp. S44760]|nr:hypothetical protein [Bachmanniomyces sp. S44760]
MAALQHVPTVTMADLAAFHLRVYGTACKSVESTYDERHDQATEHAGLGLYPDSIPRTLTDDQVAIFRHSEIHALFQQRRTEWERKLQAEEDLEHDDELPENPQKRPGLPSGLSMQAANEYVDDTGDEEEYERFLITEEEQRNAALKNQKRKRSLVPLEKDRTISTRRTVRELDAVINTDAVLDYGEESTGPVVHSSKRDDHAASVPKQGRKIWWPTIGG